MSDGTRILGRPATAAGVRCHWCGEECEIAYCPGHRWQPGLYVRCLAWDCLAGGPVRRTRRKAIRAYLEPTGRAEP